MVQGLAFLSKKSWHTKNKANQERVWLAEQKKEQETAKANELAREIQQEREAEELHRIAGKNSIKDRGINWMYQEGTSTELAKEDAAKRAEEYLLGKEYVGEGATQGDFDDGNPNEGIYSALSKTDSVGVQEQEPGQQEKHSPVARSDLNSVQYRNEKFRMKVEDPMFFVSQKEREKKTERLKTEALYHRVVGSFDDDQTSNCELSSSSVVQRRRKKDEKRKQKKHRKKRKKKSSRSRYDYDERENYGHRRKRSHHECKRLSSRSRSNDRHEERNGNDKRGYNYRSDGSHNSRHRSYDNKDTCENHRSRNTRKGKSNDGKRRFFSDVEETKTGDSSFPQAAAEKDFDPNINNPCKRVMRPVKVEGYGLKGALNECLAGRDIGPCKELIKKKKEEQQKQRNSNLRVGRSRKKLTDEERRSALLQMKADARKRENTMNKQTTDYHEKKDAETAPSSKNEALFLTEISTRVNGISSEKHSSLSSRVSQNRHTNQRLHDSFF